MEDLIVMEEIKAIEVFTDESKLDSILGKIKENALSYAPDLSTAKGRKEIASIAYKVSQSKTVLDKAGKELVKEWKENAKRVDLSRKKTREFLDDLKNEIRQPLTDFEDAERARDEKERLEEKYQSDFDSAVVDHALFLREIEIAAKEAQFKAAEEARKERERAKIAEKESAEREQKIAKAAEDKAKADAEAKAKADIEAAKRERQLAIEAEELAKREKIEAVARAKAEKELAEKLAKEAKAQAELDKINAKSKAQAEKEIAVKLAKEEAEAKAKADAEAKDKAATEAKAKAEAEEKAREEKKRIAAENMDHQRAINNIILASLVKLGIGEDIAKKVIVIVASGRVEKMNINYM